MHYGSREVLRNVTLTFAPGELVAIAGPNGAGKSTLLNVMTGLRPAMPGECLFRGRRIERWNRRELARHVSMTPQTLDMQFPFSAEQVVTMARTPFGDRLFESPEDLDAVERAMSLTETLEFRNRDFRTLSGGEKQRVVLAAALAQSPEALLLDEPTAFLDLQHQVSLYRLLRRSCTDGLLAVAVTHDLNLAAAYADRIVLLQNGEVAAQGTPREVLTPTNIERVFAVEADIGISPAGRPWIYYGG
jgi:iron complex transport system ATP-binding protein